MKLVEISCEMDEIEVVDRAKNFDLNFRVIKQVSITVRELYCQLEPKLLELEQQVDELKRIEHLTRSSEVYSEQANLYSRAASQIRKLIKEGQVLRNECLRFIRETLIGAEVSKFEPDALTDTLAWKLEFQEKCRVINEQYQTLHDEVEALSTLRRGIDSV